MIEGAAVGRWQGDPSLQTEAGHRNPGGSLVLEPTRPNKSTYSSIAQLVEHAAVNRRVVGSSPTWGAKKAEADKTASAFFTLKDSNQR